jgi:hypothetical protein
MALLPDSHACLLRHTPEMQQDHHANEDSSSRQHAAQHTSAQSSSPPITQHQQRQQHAAHSTLPVHSGATTSTSNRNAEGRRLQAASQHASAPSQLQQAAGRQLAPANKHSEQLGTARGRDTASSRQNTSKVLDQSRDRGASYADAVMDIQPLLIDDKRLDDSSSGSSGQPSGLAAAADGSAVLPSAHQRKPLLRLSLLMGVTMVGVGLGVSCMKRQGAAHIFSTQSSALRLMLSYSSAFAGRIIITAWRGSWPVCQNSYDCVYVSCGCVYLSWVQCTSHPDIIKCYMHTLLHMCSCRRSTTFLKALQWRSVPSQTLHPSWWWP